MKEILSSLKIKNYRLFFIGQAISLCGTWMQTIGQDWLVLQITKSGIQLGVVSAFQFLPVLLLAPLGGVISDRFSKRKILIITQILTSALSFILAMLIITSAVKIWMIYILAVGLGLINAVDNPTRLAFVSETVDKNNLANAVTLNSSEFNLARTIGPVIGGAVIAVLGLGACFLFSILLYFGTIITLLLINKKELHTTERITKINGQIREGIKYVISSPILFHLLIILIIIGTLSYEFSVSLPLLAKFTFNGNAQSYAFLVASLGLGSFVGGIFAAKRKTSNPRSLIVYSLLFGITLSFAAFMPTLMPALIFLFFAGIFSINFISIANTILQLESRPEMRGRVMSFWTVAFLGSTPIGGPIIGWIGEKFGARWGLSIGGITAIITAFYAWFIFSKKNIKIHPVSLDVRERDEESEIESRSKI